MAIVEAARAKINLALHVRARRTDGYHELETLFAFVADGDVLTIEKAAEDAFAVTGPFAPALAGEGDNLVLRARDRFREAFGVRKPVAIRLEKNLPVASGMGGGSADAAATLRALARLHGVSSDDPALMRCADALGSDVPACLLSTTAIGRGRGEALTPIEGAPGVPVLLVNPGVAVSTPAVFGRWDRVDRGGIATDMSLLDAAGLGRNDLQSPAIALAPEVAAVLTLLEAQPGATLVRMSGSGATCFALFQNIAARDAAAERVRVTEPGWWCLETALV